MNVFAIAPANAPDDKCIKTLDLFSISFLLCNLSSPKNKIVYASSFSFMIFCQVVPDDVTR